MLFDGVLSVFVCVCFFLDEGKIIEKGEVLLKVINIIDNGLKVGLNMEIDSELLGNFVVLYEYMVRCLLYLNLCNDVEVIVEVEVLFNNIVDVWK